MLGPSSERQTRVSEGDFIRLLAVVYAFMETNTQDSDRREVAAKVERIEDRGLAEISHRITRGEDPISHRYAVDQGLTIVSTDMVNAMGTPTKADAVTAVAEAIEVRRLLDARNRLDNIYSRLDQEETTTDLVAGELRAIAQDMTTASGWQRVDPWLYYLEREQMDPGIQFFVPEIDNLTLGCPPGRVVTVAAYTGHGKSTFTKNMAYLNAMHHGVDAPFVTLEEPAGDVEMSFVIRHSVHPKWKGIPPLVNTPTMNAALGPEQKAFYREVAEDWVNGDHAKVKVCGIEHLNGKYTVGAVVSLIKSFKPYKAVYIDYMNVFKTFDVPGAKGEYERINFAASMIRNEVCLDTPSIPLVQCCQIKRQGFERYKEYVEAGESGEGYWLSDLNEANEMEKGSAFVVALFLTDEARDSGMARVQLLKGRGSAVIEKPFDVPFAPQHFVFGERYRTERSGGSAWMGDMLNGM